MIARIPIRWRLTLGFSLAFAVLLLGLGIALRAGFAYSLDDAISASLNVRADEVRALVDANGVGGLSERADRRSEAEESFVQVLDRDGRLLGGSAPRLTRPLVDPSALGPLPADTVAPRGLGLEHRARLVVFEVGPRTVVVGHSLEDRDDALAALTLGLLLAGPIALALAGFLGHVLTGFALRPVDAMRAKAAEISGSEAGARLPVGPADDELRALGVTLNAMLDRIDGAIERERAFVADASHELRTPLAVLRTEVDLALSAPRSPQQLRTALSSAREEVMRLSRLADDLLLLARTRDGRAATTPADLDAVGICRRVAARFAASAGAQGRRLVVSDLEPTTVHADGDRLEQALGNLVDNALRHGEGEVRIGATRVENGVEFRVTDDGMGIPAEFAARAFERFSVPRSGRTGSGTGLGLAIVRAVARAHGGDATVLAGPPAGVAIRIPDRPPA